ncbi:hypothetical protein [Rhodococcus sp. ARP2]|uniref:hypothetical protein n=1 Tax=Rhodococcus sp. ARP2 TaxID=1661385 RepID=UPI00064BF650|nr:hypothetical protein [Rhodococcus sp. ARP2]
MTLDEALAELTKISETDKALTAEVNRLDSKYRETDAAEDWVARSRARIERDSHRRRNFSRLLDTAIWAVAASSA